MRVGAQDALAWNLTCAWRRRTKVLIETDDLQAAREMCVDESLRLARGRGRTIGKDAR